MGDTLVSGYGNISKTGITYQMLVNIDGSINTTLVGIPSYTLGQKTMALSIPVVIASDQSALSVLSTELVLSPSAPTNVTVGASDTAVLGSATYRLIILTNLSVNTISLGFSNPAVLNSGPTLVGTGSTFILDQPYTGTVKAIASAGSSSLAVQAFI